MKPLLLVPLILLAACGAAETSNLQGNGAAAPPPGEPDNRIDCRPAGARSFERACTVEGADSPAGACAHHPQGGWRLPPAAGLERRPDFVAADGAEAAHIVWRGAGATEVEIGGDRFRLPARPL